MPRLTSKCSNSVLFLFLLPGLTFSITWLGRRLQRRRRRGTWWLCLGQTHLLWPRLRPWEGEAVKFAPPLPDRPREARRDTLAGS